MELRRSLVWVGDIGKQDQQINVAFRIGIAPGQRTEEDDLIRGEPLGDPPNQAVRNASDVGETHQADHNSEGIAAGMPWQVAGGTNFRVVGLLIPTTKPVQFLRLDGLAAVQYGWYDG